MQKSIKKQLLYLGAIIIALVFCGVTGFIFAGYSAAQFNKKIVKLKNLSITLNQIMNSHQAWTNALLDSILKGSKFKGELNPNKCKFGTWYNSIDENYK